MKQCSPPEAGDHSCLTFDFPEPLGSAQGELTTGLGLLSEQSLTKRDWAGPGLERLRRAVGECPILCFGGGAGVWVGSSSPQPLLS